MRKKRPAGVRSKLPVEETMSSEYFARGRNNGTMVFWDLQTVLPPPNFEFLDHLLASHRAMGTGLFSFRLPLRLRAHGTEALPPAAHDYIVKNTLCLQQCISCDTEEGSSWKAMTTDMLLWATDHAPGTTDMVVISKVLDRSLADAIHQLHMRNYNIIVTTSFPPKSVPPLHEFVPPQIKLLHQVFSSSDFVWNGKRQRPLIPPATSPTQAQQAAVHGPSDPVRSGARQSASILVAASPTPRQQALCHDSVRNGARQSASVPAATSPSPVPQALYCGPLTMVEVRAWLEEMIASGRANQTGINVSQLPKDFEERTGMKLNYKSLNYPNLIALLSKFDDLVRIERNLTQVHLFPKLLQSTQGARPYVPVPGSGPVSNRPFHRPPPILVAASPTPDQQALYQNSVRNGARQSASVPAATSPSLVPQALYYGPLTMFEVRAWLEEMVASGRANQTGINVSQLPKDFEERTGMKLNYKSLNYPNLIALLSTFDDLIRIERNLTQVHLFPKYLQSTQGARPPVPVPGSCPVSYRPFPRPPRKHTPEVPVQPRIVPVSSRSGNVPGPQLPCTASHTISGGMRTPATPTVPRTTPLLVQTMPAADVTGPAAEVTVGDREARAEQNSASPHGNILAAPGPDSSPQISSKFKPPPDVLRGANTTSETNLGEQHALPTMASTSAIDEAQPSNGGMSSHAWNSRFNFYLPNDTDEEKEKADRVMRSVTQRLREEYLKKRRLE